jgi:hypothetical protein
MSDPNGIMFIVGIAVGLPMIAVTITEITKRQIAFKERALELMADKTAEKAAQYAAHGERLEQRMRVLERIATDKGADLADQIESLRDEPAPRLAAPNEEIN